ncbi:hypothetical protein AVEN_198252-1 [Araneus ventricosus]|uniref:Uncharacterized protein n=1 Tax=Araneus ventricosus TaxID=182803 RepID=A0A4Y2TNK7_ARAVE|nr:hypothetical protein AVEN_198252-1 [Araneus ventricosus]
MSHYNLYKIAQNLRTFPYFYLVIMKEDMCQIIDRSVRKISISAKIIDFSQLELLIRSVSKFEAVLVSDNNETPESPKFNSILGRRRFDQLDFDPIDPVAPSPGLV